MHYALCWTYLKCGFNTNTNCNVIHERLKRQCRRLEQVHVTVTRQMWAILFSINKINLTFPGAVKGQTLSPSAAHTVQHRSTYPCLQHSSAWHNFWLIWWKQQNKDWHVYQRLFSYKNKISNTNHKHLWLLFFFIGPHSFQSNLILFAHQHTFLLFKHMYSK